MLTIVSAGLGLTRVEENELSVGAESNSIFAQIGSDGHFSYRHTVIARLVQERKGAPVACPAQALSFNLGALSSAATTLPDWLKAKNF